MKKVSIFSVVLLSIFLFVAIVLHSHSTVRSEKPVKEDKTLVNNSQKPEDKKEAKAEVKKEPKNEPKKETVVAQVNIPQSGPDAGDNRHPSGKDRSLEPGKSGTQGKSQSDPDGMENAFGGQSGKDKPGYDGGLDKHDQDGNNGCGNDDDFEDDNNGNCGGKAKVEKIKPTVTPKLKEEKVNEKEVKVIVRNLETKTVIGGTVSSPTPTPSVGNVQGVSSISNATFAPTGNFLGNLGMALQIAGLTLSQAGLLLLKKYNKS